VPERWVLNASPLIVLAHVGREDLFLALAEQVAVPRAVASEIVAGPNDDSRQSGIGKQPIRDRGYATGTRRNRGMGLRGWRNGCPSACVGRAGLDSHSRRRFGSKMRPQFFNSNERHACRSSAGKTTRIHPLSRRPVAITARGRFSHRRPSRPRGLEKHGGRGMVILTSSPHVRLRP